MLLFHCPWDFEIILRHFWVQTLLSWAQFEIVLRFQNSSYEKCEISGIVFSGERTEKQEISYVSGRNSWDIKAIYVQFVFSFGILGKSEQNLRHFWDLFWSPFARHFKLIAVLEKQLRSQRYTCRSSFLLHVWKFWAEFETFEISWNSRDDICEISRVFPSGEAGDFSWSVCVYLCLGETDETLRRSILSFYFYLVSLGNVSRVWDMFRSLETL